jgi:hypothetical protein
MLFGSLAVLGLAAVCLALVRPQWVPGSSSSLRRRAEGYWTARAAGDLKGMSLYAHPDQQPLPSDTLLATTGFEITDVKVDGENGFVSIKAKHRVKLSETNSLERDLVHRDSWVRLDGEWYHALHPVGVGEILSHGLGKWKPPVAKTATARK